MKHIIGLSLFFVFVVGCASNNTKTKDMPDVKELPDMVGQDTGGDVERDEGAGLLPDDTFVPNDVVDIRVDDGTSGGDDGISVYDEITATDPGVGDETVFPDPGFDDCVDVDVQHDSGPVQKKGECKSADDCNGKDCVNLDSIDFHVCKSDVPKDFPECTEPKNPEFDECCSNADCDGDGGCYFTNHIDHFGGGMPVEEHKICIWDECQNDDDCTTKDNDGNPVPGICLPGAVNNWPRTRCITNYCEKIGGCPAGSYCRPMQGPCGSAVYIAAFCAGPDTCETNADCTDGKTCVGDTKTGMTKCKIVYCPASAF